jgi:hypothetical protein
VALAESLAAASTAILSSNDPRPVEEVLRFVQKRNESLRSIGLRSRQGKLVLTIGDHARVGCGPRSIRSPRACW